jgi:hypothetical protein
MNYESIPLSQIAKDIGYYSDSQNAWDNGFYGHKGYINPMDANNYANKVAYDLQNEGALSPDAPNWDPAAYRLVQEPNGQFVGQIQNN